MVDSPFRILMVDDQQSFAGLFAERLEQNERPVVVDKAVSLEAARASLQGCFPDLIFLELELPGCSPYAVLRAFSPEAGESMPPVALLTSFWSPFLLGRAVQQKNFRGYLLKQDSPEELYQLAQRVIQGECAFSSVLKKDLQFDPLTGRILVQDPSRLSELTEWQLELLQQLGAGKGLRDIARRERLSFKSIDGFQHRILCRLGLQNRSELLRLAIREGLLQP